MDQESATRPAIEREMRGVEREIRGGPSQELREGRRIQEEKNRDQAQAAGPNPHYIDKGKDAGAALGRLHYNDSPAPPMLERVMTIAREAQGFERRGAVAIRAAAILDQHPEFAALIDALVELRILRVY